MNVVTLYAYQFILKQQTLQKKVKILTQRNDFYTISSSEGINIASPIIVNLLVIGTLSVASSSC